MSIVSNVVFQIYVLTMERLHFKNKQYYGLVNELTLQETEKILDYLVVTNQITYFFTQNGKLYCTFDYYKTKHH